MTWHKRLLKRLRKYSVIYPVVFLFVFFAACPFVTMGITMFKADIEFYYQLDSNRFWYEEDPTTEHITDLVNNTPYMDFVENSLYIGVVVVLITLVTSMPASYALARLTGQWGEKLGMGMFLIYLIPPTLLFIPMARVVAVLGLTDSKWALILTYPTFTIPFCTWLLVGFMKSIPKDLEEQAMVDGYSRLGAIIRVVFPLTLPGILTVVVFAFMLSLHEFIYALAFVATSTEKPISVGVPTELVRGDVFYWQSLMAAAVLVAIPVAVVYNIFLNRFISGFTLGAVKG